MSSIQDYVNSAAETYLKTAVALPSELDESARNSIMLVAMVRALVIMANSKRFQRKDVHAAVEKEFELLYAAQQRAGTKEPK